MTTIEKAIEILRCTRDGEDLAPRDLRLVETAVNVSMYEGLTEAGEASFDDLYRRATSRQYRKPWLHDVENLTIDHVGYVYWRDIQVEHFTYYGEGSREQLATWARQLGAACARLEARGEAVSFLAASNEAHRQGAGS